MTKKKSLSKLKIFGISIVTFLILIVSGVLATSIFIPGFGNSIISVVTMAPDSCANTPYDWNCECTIDREKVPQDFKYYCITASPKASTDCAWCAGECLEWIKVWEQDPSAQAYNEFCDPRTAISGQACVARISEFGNLECAAVPSINTEGLIEFCSNAAIAEVVTESQATNEELVQFFRSGCPVPGISPIDNCDLAFIGGIGTTILSGGRTIESGIVECRSACTDSAGTVVGGRILWSVMWNTEDRTEIIGQPDGGSDSTSCIDGV